MVGRVAGLLAAGFVLGGCFKPSFSDGQVACGDNALCPPGYSCGADGFCYAEGSGPTGGDDQTGDPRGPGDDNGGDVAGGDLNRGDRGPSDANAGDLAGGDVNQGDTHLIVPVTVEAVYPTNADWNDYIKNDDPSEDEQHQDDVACDATADSGPGGPGNCIHGGEKRKVSVPGLTDCTGYTAEDTLMAWEWLCDDNGGAGPVEWFTVGLRAGAGLGDIVDASGFLPNAVTVRNAGLRVVAESTPAVWGWGNSFIELTDNSAGPPTGLDVPSQIYVVAQPIQTAGFNLDADRVALVTLPGASLTWGFAGNDSCAETGGELAMPDRRVVVCGGSQDFVWLEGTLNNDPPAGTHGQSTIWFRNMRFARIHRVSSHESDGVTQISIGLTQNSEISSLSSSDSGLNGVAVFGADHNLVRDLRITNAANNGMLVTGGSTFNRFQDVYVEGSGNDGIRLDMGNDDYNTFIRTTVVGTLNAAMRVNSDYNRFYDYVAANSDNGTSTGIEFRGGRYNIVVGAKLYNMSDFPWRGCCEVAEGNGNNITVNLLSVSSDGHNVYAQAGTDRPTFSHVTVAFADDRNGFSVSNAANATANNVLSVNNLSNVHVGSSGMPTARDFVGINIAAAHGQFRSVRLTDGTTGNRFTENLLIDAPCGSAGGSEGVIGTTCTTTGADGSSDYTPWLSDAVLHTGTDATGSFVGKVMTDDAVNTSDNLGTAAHMSLTDWTGFENPYRTWGEAGTAIDTLDSTGQCNGGMCQIWDWSLRATDTEFLNFNCRGDGDCNFGDNDPCPLSAGGDRVQIDQTRWPWYAGINALEDNAAAGGNDDGICEAGEDCYNQFLMHATEIVLDGAGDDDGLCESNEACIYSPNLGVYQGSGDYMTRRCNFTDGLVAGVTMYAYPQNGE